MSNYIFDNEKLVIKMKKITLMIFFSCLTLTGAAFAENVVKPANILKPKNHLSRESATCISCHKEQSPGIYQQWGSSSHYGANIGCYECHKSKAGAPDAMRHKDFVVSVIVSPNKCGECHKTEVEQFSNSHHSKAAEILGSLDNVLAEVVEGHNTFNGESPAAVSGCWQCHGSVVKVMPNGNLDPTTWPNSGIGRINPDGSRGSCTACHQRHEFSLTQARRPEACGKCHLGPDHPQKEIFDESKHGISFYANVDKMKLDNKKWIPGEDYDAGATCATCHMSATKDLPVTHDVGARISWTLRPPISEKVDASSKGKVKSWIERRKDMRSVCESCHENNMIGNFYEQFDHLVELYNNKFAKPGTALMNMLSQHKLITAVPFDSKLKFVWFEIWHHEGRRARQGTSMQAPDYTQWHGMYEVAKNFYGEFIPEIKEYIEKGHKSGNIQGANAVQTLLDEILSRPEHMWFTGQMSADEKIKRQKSQDEFKTRYMQDDKK